MGRIQPSMSLAPRNDQAWAHFQEVAAVIVEVAGRRSPRRHWRNWPRYVPQHTTPDGIVPAGRNHCAFTWVSPPHDPQHLWHRELQRKSSDTHPAVRAVLEGGWAPADLNALVLEWPTVSEDGTRLAYTQSEAKGEREMRTVTTPGRYIRRHWPLLTDDYIRDVVARVVARCELRSTTEEIVQAAQEGPRSCMRFSSGHIEDELDGHHPYEVYAPKFGWRIAVRIQNDSIDGRALVLMPSKDAPVKGETLKGAWFVRSYARSPGDGYSSSDTALEAWLVHNGASKVDDWSDCGDSSPRLARIQVDRVLLMPYLDGSAQRVSDDGDELRIESDGEIEADRTSGYARSDYLVCDDCGDEEPEEDGTWVGYRSDRWVCSSCVNGYTYAYGRGGDQYYIPDEDTVYFDGSHYHRAYLADNDVVELDDGYARLSDTFICPVDDRRYRDEEGVWCEDTNCLVYEDNCWQDEVSLRWYSDDTENTTDDEGRTVLVPDDGNDAPEPAEPACSLEELRRVDPSRSGTWVTAPGFDDPHAATSFAEAGPPYPGWWSVIYCQPCAPDAYPREFSFWDGRKFTHRTTTGPAGVSLVRDDLQVDVWMHGNRSIYWRPRHPTWAVATRQYAERRHQWMSRPKSRTTADPAPAEPAPAEPAPAEPAALQDTDFRPGPPPSVGWWCTHRIPPALHRDGRTALFRYWDGRIWSTDVGSEASPQEVEFYKPQTALARQDSIQHCLVRAPWDTPAEPTPFEPFRVSADEAARAAELVEQMRQAAMLLDAAEAPRSVTVVVPPAFDFANFRVVTSPLAAVPSPAVVMTDGV